MVIDNISPAGSYRRELDYKLDTVGKLWNEIYELRDRIKEYTADIERLETEVAELKRVAENQWVREP